MNNQEILDHAPERCLIVDSKFRFFDGRYSELDKTGSWTWKKTMPAFPIRAIADIKRIVELEKLVYEVLSVEHKRGGSLHSSGQFLYKTPESVFNLAQKLKDNEK